LGALKKFQRTLVRIKRDFAYVEPPLEKAPAQAADFAYPDEDARLAAAACHSPFAEHL